MCYFYSILQKNNFLFLFFWSNLRGQLWVIYEVLQRVAAAEFVQQTGQVADYGRWVGGVDVARDVPDLNQRHVPVSVEPMGRADLHNRNISAFLHQTTELRWFRCCLPPGWYRRPPRCWGWCWTGPPWGRCCCWWSLGTEGRRVGRSGPGPRRRNRSTAPDRSWSSGWWFGPRSRCWCPAQLDEPQKE